MKLLGNAVLREQYWLAIFNAWLRGLLTNARATKVINVGMAINLVIMATVLAIGLFKHYPGLLTAAIALNIAILCEIMYLTWRAGHLLPGNMPLFRPRTPRL